METTLSLGKYEACLARKKVNHSRAREAIYRLFLESKNVFMSVAELHKKLDSYYPKKVSVNTVYRHLSLFVSCNLLLLLQDDNKKAYYILVDDEVPVFTICPKCQIVGVEKVTEKQRKILAEMIFCTEKEKAPFVVLHKTCKQCR